MKRILRLGLSVVLATVLAVTAAWAVEYDGIFELTERGVSERTIVQLIVDDGRAFELDADELADLRAAGVSEAVIAAMLDPAVGRAWLAGGVTSVTSGSGYSTSLDEAYNEGYSAGVSSTALVYSFGYYYGPLSRYYYNDPFYYPFWSSGYYGYSYWPSYYSYWYRPYYDCYYAYPYNWYGYNSYYCHSYYDAGYWGHNGYYTQPGYGHSVWDNGPRFRGGGVTPPKGGRPDGDGANSRLAIDNVGRMRNVSGPPAIREAEGGRTPTDRSGAGSGLATRTGRGVDTPSARTPSSRSSGTKVIRGADAGSGRSSTSTRVIRGGGATRGEPTASATRSSGRSAGGTRVSNSEPRRLRDSADRVMRSGRTGSSGRTARGETPSSARIFRSGGRQLADARVSTGRGSSGRSAGSAQSQGGGRASAPAPQMRSAGGGHSGGAAHGGGGSRSAGGSSGGGRGGR